MRRLLLFIALAASAGCGDEATPGANPNSSADASSATSPAALAERLQSGSSLVDGTIREKIDASSYSYLRLETLDGEVWAAVPRSDVAVGSRVAIDHATPMYGFESPTLGRTFDQILFGTLQGQTAGLSHQPPAQAPAPQPASDRAAAIPVARAEGPDGRSVAEIYAQRADLDGQTIAVRGEVVKLNLRVMGKTWLHIRDGSGSPDSGDNDLTVTTAQEDVQIGDVVLVTGTLSKDRDFGAGYSYDVIVEQATVVVSDPSLKL